MEKYSSDAATGAGCLLVATGLFSYSAPMAAIWLGACLMVAGLVLAHWRATQPPPPPIDSAPRPTQHH